MCLFIKKYFIKYCFFLLFLNKHWGHILLALSSCCHPHPTHLCILGTQCDTNWLPLPPRFVQYCQTIDSKAKENCVYRPISNCLSVKLCSLLAYYQSDVRYNLHINTTWWKNSKVHVQIIIHKVLATQSCTEYLLSGNAN